MNNLKLNTLGSPTNIVNPYKTPMQSKSQKLNIQIPNSGGDGDSRNQNSSNINIQMTGGMSHSR